MKHRLRRGWLALVPLLPLVPLACAESADEAPLQPPPAEDAQVEDRRTTVDAAVEAEAAPPKGPLCSPQGWCATNLPEPPPRFDELWPVAKAAFAVDRNNGIFAFDGSGAPTVNRWAVINDGPSGLTTVWAPNADEVWAGGDGGRVVHGVRNASSWSWSTEVVADGESIVAIWGDGPSDVFVLSTNRLFRRKTAGSSFQLALEKRGDTVPPACSTAPELGTFTFTKIVATSADDIWISGRKNAVSGPPSANRFCDYLVHKSGESYETVADCKIEFHDNGSGYTYCDYQPTTEGPRIWFDDAFTVAPGRLIAHWRGAYQAGPGQWTRIEKKPSGYTSSSIETMTFGFVWGASEDKVYVGTPGRIYVNDQLWNGGQFDISSIALNGVPLEPTFRIRGRSADDIWAIGGPYALHKTAP